jgi:hypothetical protein
LSKNGKENDHQGWNNKQWNKGRYRKCDIDRQVKKWNGMPRCIRESNMACFKEYI